MDELVGLQQVVLRMLGDTMRGIAGISGGAIMPDGQVGLILDVAGPERLTHANQTVDGGASHAA
jgi:two-component system chemotaxis sensor kinase CheA